MGCAAGSFRAGVMEASKAMVVTNSISQVPAVITVAPPIATGGSTSDKAREIQVKPTASKPRYSKLVMVGGFSTLLKFAAAVSIASSRPGGTLAQRLNLSANDLLPSSIGSQIR